MRLPYKYALRCHPERIPRTREESKDPREITLSSATGFLDCARNDSDTFAELSRARIVLKIDGPSRS